MNSKPNLKKLGSKENIPGRKGQRPTPSGQNVGPASNPRIHSAGAPDRGIFKHQSASNNPYDFIERAIHEYLLKRDYAKTSEVFKDEIQYIPSRNKEADSGYVTQLLELFDKGHRENFFNKWNKFVPLSIRTKDDECSKLEFYLHIYFVVYPSVKKGQNLDKSELYHFRVFLDTKGADLANTTEFLSYYALPYVPNPLEHPSFKHIFKKEWIVDVRKRLESFITNTIPQDAAPMLMKMYNAYNKIDGRESVTDDREKDLKLSEKDATIKQLENSNKELLSILNEFNVKYGNLLKNYNIVQKNEEIARNNLFESHNKWINFAKELLAISKDMLKMIDYSKNGVPFQEQILQTLRSKISTYESFLNSNIEDLASQSQDQSAFDKTGNSQDFETPDYSSISQLGTNLPQQKGNNNPQQFKAAQAGQPCQLDFDQIEKCFLTSANENLICGLLQALRWRITRTHGAVARREVLIAYSKHDVLGLMKDNNKILNRILINGKAKVTEYTARFINALASDYCGRSYLLEAPKTVQILIDLLRSEKGDTLVRRNCLGALQKLSLRRKPQTIMIESNLIKWIVQTLKIEKYTLSEYSYEYATALFMNLSLRTAGKKQCEDPTIEVLPVFNELLEHENLQVRTFVNGTLYSLLSRPVLREQAKAIGMNEILDYLMDHSEERFKKQIQYIKDQLNSDKEPEDDNDEVNSDTNEDENDVDDNDEDDEIGEDDDVEDNIEIPNLPVGEELLEKHFSLSGPEALKQTSMIQEALEDNKSMKGSRILYPDGKKSTEVPLNRPATPSMVNKLLGDQNLALELQSKPRLARTPVLEEKAHYEGVLQNQKQPYHQNVKQNPDLRKPVPVENNFLNVPSKNDDNQLGDSKEFKKAFESRPRVVRTPPGGDSKSDRPSMYDYGDYGYGGQNLMRKPYP